jgi:hypothetical protein
MGHVDGTTELNRYDTLNCKCTKTGQVQDAKVASRQHLQIHASRQTPGEVGTGASTSAQTPCVICDFYVIRGIDIFALACLF